MKKKTFLIMLSVLIIAGLSACSTANKDVAGSTESTIATTLDEKSTTENTTEKETAKSESTTKKIDNSDTTTKPTEQKSAGHTTTKKVTATQKQTTTVRQTTTKKVTETQRQTTTQKQTTTKREVTTTTKQNKLTKSDIEWVQSQANSYIKSKGCTLNSNVDSFSGRISSKPYTNKSELLEKVKDSIDYEYQHCIDSDWDSVDMFCKVESRSDGSYFIYVMYG